MTGADTVEQKSSSILKPAVFLMCGRTMAFIATFFIPVVLARIFDKAIFGTYKQLFLIHSTAYFIAQVGMASSLYYFIPQSAKTAGRYAANSVAFLAGAGAIGFSALLLAAPYLAKWMNNPDLVGYLGWTGLFLALMMVSASLEIVMIARGKYRLAAASYASSDIARAIAFVVPVLIFRTLESLLIGSVIVAFLRVVATLAYFRTVFAGEFRVDGPVLRKQLAYALPFGAAVLVEIFYSSVPQYVVSFVADPATFAVFAVGCLQIPLVDFAASPTSDVMMVKMQESLAAGSLRTVVEIWHDTFWKLALLFFPLVALVVVEGRDVILALYTTKYAASVPLFRVWSALILLTTLQIDGVLRVFAETRFILMLNLLRLAIVGTLIAPSMHYFGLLGPVMVILLATVAFKLTGLIRVISLFGIGVRRILPWRRTALLMSVSIIAALAVIGLKSQLNMRPLALLFVSTAVYSVVYCALVWRLRLLTESERIAVRNLLQKIVRRSRVRTAPERESVQKLCAESPVSSV